VHERMRVFSTFSQLKQKIAENPNDAGMYLNLAKVQEYLLDLYEMRRTRRPWEKRWIKPLTRPSAPSSSMISRPTHIACPPIVTAEGFHWGTRCLRGRSSARKSKKKTSRPWH